ncbi:hypothetical protein STSO111631_09340 [Stackebrandtia soli]
MTSDINATSSSTPDPTSTEAEETSTSAVSEELDLPSEESEPAHPLAVKLRAAGDSAVRLASEAKTTAVRSAHVARIRVTEVSAVGVRAVKRVPRTAWVATGISAAAVGLGLLAKRRRNRRRR